MGKNLKTQSDKKLITHHLPQSDQCTAGLWAMGTSDFYSKENLFGQFGSAVLTMLPPKLLPSPGRMIPMNAVNCGIFSKISLTEISLKMWPKV